MTVASSILGDLPVGSMLTGGLTQQTLQVWINGVDVTGSVYIGSGGTEGFTVSEILTGATTATLNLVETDASSGPSLDIKVGHEVVIEVKGQRLFGGQVADVRRINPGQSDALFWRLACRDHSVCLERRLLAASFEDTGDPITQTVGDIITTVFNNILDDGCIILGTIEDGPLIQKANFNYITVLQAFNELQTLSGNAYYWKVDAFGVLSFRARTAIAAPYNIDDTQEKILDIDFDTTKESYRNRQFVRGGKTETEARLNEFEADGKLKAFTCDLPLAAKPVIEVSTVAVDPSAIGIKGVDDDDASITWLWARDDAVVTAKTAPTAGADIEITFQGLYRIIVQRDDAGEQTQRAAIENGNGIYESVDVDESLNLSTTRQKADALLDKYGQIPQRVSYQTDRSGDLRPGQLQTVTLTVLNVPAIKMVIEQVETTLVGEDLRRTVNATDGREWLEWLEFFRKLIRDPFIVRENESILIPTVIEEDLVFTDSVSASATDTTITYTDDPYTWMIVGPGFRIGKAIDDLGVVLFEDSREVDGPKIGSPVNI